MVNSQLKSTILEHHRQGVPTSMGHYEVAEKKKKSQKFFLGGIEVETSMDSRGDSAEVVVKFF